MHFAKSSAGWSTYLNGLPVDIDQFRDELRRVCEHVRNQAAKAENSRSSGLTWGRL